MDANQIWTPRWRRVGGGLILSGIVLSYGLEFAEVPIDGPPIYLIATLFGAGGAVLLFLAFRTLISRFDPTLFHDEASQLAEPSNLFVADRWRRRAKLAVLYSVAAAIVAVGLYALGVAAYFTNFSFASNGNRGFNVIAAGLGMGMVFVLSDLLAIVAGAIAWRKNGSWCWFVAALILPALAVLAFVFTRDHL